MLTAGAPRTALADAGGGDGPRQRQQASARVALLEEPGSGASEPELLRMATVLRDDPALTGVLNAQGLPAEQVAALRCGLPRPLSARRPLHPLLEPLRRPLARASVEHHALRVIDYAGKDAAVEQVGGWATARGLSPRHVAALELALDEMLLNALYNAPHDEHGASRYVALSPQERLSVVARPGEHAEVRYGGDRRRLVVAVRDRFGALRRDTVLSYLIHCAAAARARKNPLESKVSGAGVGLYLIASAASEILFHLRGGRLTEVILTLYRDRPRPLRALLIDDRPGDADSPSPPMP